MTEHESCTVLRLLHYCFCIGPFTKFNDDSKLAVSHENLHVLELVTTCKTQTSLHSAQSGYKLQDGTDQTASLMFKL